MFKLLLCDDDEIVLEGLKSWVQAAHPEIQLAGLAIHGRMAKELIDRHRPHIVITDICMPFFSGLELIEYAKSVNPYLRSIIISGYDDFKYARKAVQLGAMDFILKPIDIGELDRLLTAAVKECALAQKNHESRIGDAFRSIVDCTDPAQISRIARRASLPENHFYMISILENERCVTDDPEELNVFRYASYKEFNLLADQFKALGCVVVSQSHASMVLGFRAPQREDLLRLCTQAEALVRQYNGSHTQHFFTMAKGTVYRGIAGLRDSYAEAIVAIRYRLILNSDIISYSTIVESRLPVIREDVFTDSYFSLDRLTSYAAINQGIERLWQTLQAQTQDRRFCGSLIVSNIYVNLARELIDCGIRLTDLFADPMLELQSILRAPDLSEMLEVFRAFLCRIKDQVDSFNQNKHAKIAGSAINYMKAHYADPALGLESTARSVFMSPNYFSAIFKEQTGQTFTDYLIAYRIEKAKALIENTDYMFYEISAMVGYPNAPYFSALFKKRTNCSPSEYKAKQTRWGK